MHVHILHANTDWLRMLTDSYIHGFKVHNNTFPIPLWHCLVVPFGIYITLKNTHVPVNGFHISSAKIIFLFYICWGLFTQCLGNVTPTVCFFEK